VATNNGVTTITLDVGRIKTYAQAGLNAVAMVLSMGAVSSAIGAPAVAVITAADSALSAALDGFAAAAGNSLTITYGSTSIGTKVDSVFAALEAVSADLGAGITAALGALGSADAAKVTAVNDALKTVVSVFSAMAGDKAVSVRGNAMPEVRALRVLGVAG